MMPSLRRLLCPAVVAGLLVSLATACRTRAEDTAPAEWLKSQPAPHFREGHALPPLTRMSSGGQNRPRLGR